MTAKELYELGCIWVAFGVPNALRTKCLAVCYISKNKRYEEYNRSSPIQRDRE